MMLHPIAIMFNRIMDGGAYIKSIGLAPKRVALSKLPNTLTCLVLYLLLTIMISGLSSRNQHAINIYSRKTSLILHIAIKVGRFIIWSLLSFIYFHFILY